MEQKTNSFYFTSDNDGARIAPNACIIKINAPTLKEAEERFLAGDLEAKGTMIGDFGDCWVKIHGRIEDADLSPFSLDELNVQEPGTHPGGNVRWVTPSAPVRVSTY